MSDAKKREKLYCPHCKSGDVLEKMIDIKVFPHLENKIGGLKYFECESCGNIFYDEATVVLLIMAMKG